MIGLGQSLEHLRQSVAGNQLSVNDFNIGEEREEQRRQLVTYANATAACQHTTIYILQFYYLQLFHCRCAGT